MNTTADGYVTVAAVGDIPEGGCKIVRVDDQSVAVFRVNGAYYAIDDVCTHDGGPLAEGTLEGAVIECPRHGARFDITTGRELTLEVLWSGYGDVQGHVNWADARLIK